MKIYLSPSQQYYNKYSAGDTTEKEQCNRIAEHCERALIRCGFEVKRAAAGTKTDDAIAESNAWGAQLHVPIHTNAGGGKGCVVFVSQLSEDRLRYAQAVYDELSEITVADESYGVRTARFDEIRKTSGKCIYVEAEFHDSVEGGGVDNRKRRGDRRGDLPGHLQGRRHRLRPRKLRERSGKGEALGGGDRTYAGLQGRLLRLGRCADP